MKVLHLVVSLGGGGLERMVVDLAIQQAKNQAQPEIACLFGGGRLEAEARAAGIPVHVLGKRPGPDFRVVWALSALVRRHGFNLVHSHNAMPAYYAAAMRLLRVTVPLVNTHHNAGTLTHDRTKSWLFRLAARAHAAIAFVSRESMDRLLAAGEVTATQSTVIVNGIPVARFVATEQADRAALRRSMGLPTDRLVCGTIGRMVDVKNQALLVDAVLDLVAEGHPVCAVIAGDGPERARVAGLVSRRAGEASVFLLGERTDVPQVLRALDVFVLPSFSEGYSIALVEAAASSLPLIATRVGGNPEIVREGVTGLLVPPGGREELVGALRRMLLDPALRQQFASGAFAWASSHGDVVPMAAAYDRLYGAAT